MADERALAIAGDHAGMFAQPNNRVRNSGSSRSSTVGAEVGQRQAGLQVGQTRVDPR